MAKKKSSTPKEKKRNIHTPKEKTDAVPATRGEHPPPSADEGRPCLCETIPPLEEAARQMVFHENELTNHRISWLLTFEGLLFAALGFAWDKPDGTLLIRVFCVLGALVPLSIWPSLHGSEQARKRLAAWWKSFEYRTEKHEKEPLGIIGFQHKTCCRKVFAWFMPWHFFVVLFVCAWIAIGVIDHKRQAPTKKSPVGVICPEESESGTVQAHEPVKQAGGMNQGPSDCRFGLL